MVRATRLALFVLLPFLISAAPPPAPGWLGLRLEPASETEQKAAGISRPAPKVTRVFPQSPALAAGLAAGDLVLQLDGKDVTDVRDLVGRVGGTASGSTVEVKVFRGTETVTLKATLADKPDQQALYRSEWENRPLPTLDLMDAVGNGRVALSAEAFKGKVVILDYFATWCGPCKRLSRDLHELHTREKGRGLEILAITGEEAGVVQPWLKGESHPYPVLIDDKKGFEETFAPSVMPTLWMVDKKGVVRGVWLGAAEYPAIAKRAAELLAE